MSCNCNPNDLLNQTNSVLGGCYPTPTFSNGGSYVGVLLTSSSFTLGTITNTTIQNSAISGTSVTGLPTPTLASDAVTKSYADTIAYRGPDIHAACVAATVGTSITLTGGAPATLDGRTLVLNDRVLVKDQTNSVQNGIYYVSTLGSGSNGTWSRVSDADFTGELFVGAQVQVQYGTINGGSNWVLSGSVIPTIGTSSIIFVRQYSFTALPAAKVTGQLIDSQLANVSASKLFGTSTISSDVGVGTNTRVRIGPEYNGILVGSKLSLTKNGSDSGVTALFSGGNGTAQIETDSASNSGLTVFLLRNSSGVETISLRSDGTVGIGKSLTILSSTASYISNSLTVGNTVQAANLIGTASVTTPQLTVSGTANVTGNVTVASGNILAVVGNIQAGTNLEALTGHVAANELILDNYITPTTAGSAGNATINRVCGAVTFAAGANTLTVTNSFVTDQSTVLLTMGSDDNTARDLVAVVSAGSLVIKLKTAPTAPTRVNFLVVNGWGGIPPS
jgi:hypothetical protein